MINLLENSVWIWLANKNCQTIQLEVLLFVWNYAEKIYEWEIYATKICTFYAQKINFPYERIYVKNNNK